MGIRVAAVVTPAQRDGMPFGLAWLPVETFRKGHLAVAHVHKGEPALGLGGTKVRPAHHAGDALEIQLAIAVPVADEDNLRVDALQPVQHLEPIRDAIIQRIMRDEDHRPSPDLGELPVQPAHVLRREMPVAHLHQRTLMEANETVSAVVEDKPVAAEDKGEIRRARLGPLGVVVARDQVEWRLQAGKDVLGQGELRSRTIFRDVAGDHNKADLRHRVDVADGGAEVVRGGFRAHMGVAQPGEAETVSGPGGQRQRAQGEQEQHEGES
ncbi:MAG TPA: hypothetical protein VI136_21880 [Verrucomicrobiae bacterium]